MSTNKDPIFFNSVFSDNTTFTSADTTVAKTIATVTADGGGVTNLSASSSDSAAITVVLTLNDGSTVAQLGEVIVPIGAGTNGTTPAKNLLDAVAMPGIFQNDGSLAMGPSAILQVAAKVTMTTGTLGISATGGNYATV